MKTETGQYNERGNSGTAHDGGLEETFCGSHLHTCHNELYFYYTSQHLSAGIIIIISATDAVYNVKVHSSTEEIKNIW